MRDDELRLPIVTWSEKIYRRRRHFLDELTPTESNCLHDQVATAA